MKARKKLLLITTVLALLLSSAGVFAQNLDNQTSGVIENSGTIRFISNAGEFRNANATRTDLVNSGTIEFQGSANLFTDGVGGVNGATALGVDGATWRIDGTVMYNSASAQTMQARYYTNLSTDLAGAKTIVDAVYVSAVYSNLGAGTRTYLGTFYYDGTSTQDIASENGLTGTDNRYNSLDISNGGLKTIQNVSGAGGEVYVAQDFTSDGTTGIVIDDDMSVGQTGGAGSTVAGAVSISVGSAEGTFTMGAAAIDFTGAVLIGSASNVGSFTINGAGNGTFSGTATVADGSTLAMSASIAGSMNVDGTLTLASGTTGGLLNIGAADLMNVNGVFANAFTARTNMTFDVSSTVAYNGTGAQDMITTVLANPYGNLTTTGTGTKSPTNSTGSNNDIFVLGNLSVTDGNIDMLNGTDGYLALKGDGTATVTYAGTEEIIGKMRYTNTLGGNLTLGTYTLNNTNTNIAFTGFDTNPPDFWQMDSRPATSPNNYVALTDINRTLITTYDNASGKAAWVATIQTWYTGPEQSAMTGGTEGLLKFYEDATATTDVERIGGTGAPIVLNAPANTMSLAGITGATASAIDGTVDKFQGSGNVLMMRASDIIYAVNDGRWSNPGTWDTYAEPTSNDNVVIDSYTVHAGFTRPNVDNFTGTENYFGDMAKSLTIEANTGSSLIVGRGTAGDEGDNLFIFSQNPVVNKANAGANPGVASADYTTMKGESIPTGRRTGLLIYEAVTANGSLRALTLTNQGGSIYNGGLLEIGN